MAKDEFTFYILNQVTGSKIEFLLVPEEISESFSSSFESQDIMGRTAPIVGFSSSGPHTVSLNITIQADMEGGIENMKKKINQLIALTYPVYSGDLLEPPKCFVRVGNMVGMYGYIESVDVSWEKPYTDMVFRKAEISLSVNEIRNNAGECLDAKGIESGGIFQI
jgi:hypothetical protein